MPENTPGTTPRTTRTRAVLGATVLVLAAALSACGGSSDAGGSADGEVTLRVGQLGSAKVTEALLTAAGEDQGMDYSVEYSIFPSGGGGFYEAVPSGSVDLAQMADTPPIFGQVAGVDARIIGVQTSLAEGESTVNVFAPKGSPLTSMADLKGKKVALTEGTILQYTVVKALEKAGLSYTDITPVNLPPADAVTAFQGGDVDAVATLGPQLATLRLAGAKVIGDGIGITSGYQYSVAASTALADAPKAKAMVDFLQRVGRAQEWSNDHEAEWIPKYAAVLGVPEPLATALVEREEFAWVPIDASVIAKQQEQADAYTSLGLIKHELDVADEFDDSHNADLAE